MRNWKTWDNQGVRENVPDADECFCSLEVNELLLGYETFLSRFNGESPAARVRRDESRSVRDCSTPDGVRAMCGKFHEVRAIGRDYKSRWRTNSSASPFERWVEISLLSPDTDGEDGRVASWIQTMRN